MKPFRTYITERLAIEDNPYTFTPPQWSGKQSLADIAFEKRQKARYGGVMARLAARALADARKRQAAPRRPQFPWQGKAESWGNSGIAGWWHPQEQWFTFTHDGGGYHVTQITKSPSRFGVTRAEILKAGERDADARNADWQDGRGEAWYDHEGTEHPWTGERVIRGIEKTHIDLSYEVQRLAYLKGWLKVYAGRQPHLEGLSRAAIKTAMREIAELRGGDTPVEVVFTGFAPQTERRKIMRAREWSTL